MEIYCKQEPQFMLLKCLYTHRARLSVVDAQNPTSLWSDFFPFFYATVPCGSFSLFLCISRARQRKDKGKDLGSRDNLKKKMK